MLTASRCRRGRGSIDLQTKSTHGASDVLQRLLTRIIECKVDLANRVFMHTGRDTNSTRLGDTFQSGGDIDSITENVAVLLHDVADIYSDAKQDVAVFGLPGVAASDFGLRRQ